MIKPRTLKDVKIPYWDDVKRRIPAHDDMGFPERELWERRILDLYYHEYRGDNVFDDHNVVVGGTTALEDLAANVACKLNGYKVKTDGTPDDD